MYNQYYNNLFLAKVFCYFKLLDIYEMLEDR